jgi:3-isopropylmalate dehydrogenase
MTLTLSNALASGLKRIGQLNTTLSTSGSTTTAIDTLVDPDNVQDDDASRLGFLRASAQRERRDDGNTAVDTCIYHRFEIERIAERAFAIARLRRHEIVSVDKANVLETSRLWREIVTEMSDANRDVKVTHMLVDNCAMQLVRDPSQFDVILTENMFGDILSDEASMITGSLGLLPSASLSDAKDGKVFGLYEPVHGSAPDIAGQGRANPIAAILSAAMMLRYSFDDNYTATRIENAVDHALEAGLRTADIYEKGTRVVSTNEMGDAISFKLQAAA